MPPNISKMGCPGGSAVKEDSCQHRRHGLHARPHKMPHALEQLLNLSSRAPEPKLLSLCATTPAPARPGACALQQAEPPRWEAGAPQFESRPCLPWLQENLHSSEGPAQPKINKRNYFSCKTQKWDSFPQYLAMTINLGKSNSRSSWVVCSIQFYLGLSHIWKNVS